VEDIKLMRKIVGEAVGVKASGRIRDLATARAMVDAGHDAIQITFLAPSRFVTQTLQSTDRRAGKSRSGECVKAGYCSTQFFLR
jgi:deoxyribose-phosphate aldolase